MDLKPSVWGWEHSLAQHMPGKHMNLIPGTKTNPSKCIVQMMTSVLFSVVCKVLSDMSVPLSVDLSLVTSSATAISKVMLIPAGLYLRLLVFLVLRIFFP